MRLRRCVRWNGLVRKDSEEALTLLKGLFRKAHVFPEPTQTDHEIQEHGGTHSGAGVAMDISLCCLSRNFFWTLNGKTKITLQHSRLWDHRQEKKQQLHQPRNTVTKFSNALPTFKEKLYSFVKLPPPKKIVSAICNIGCVSTSSITMIPFNS